MTVIKNGTENKINAIVFGVGSMKFLDSTERYVPIKPAIPM